MDVKGEESESDYYTGTELKRSHKGKKFNCARRTYAGSVPICFRVEVLNVREAQTEFFSSFFRASNRLGAPGVANYNACPVLGHLITSGVHLRSIRELLDTTRILGNSLLPYEAVITIPH
ncbi:hypothetical protein C8J57DRAFT_1234022 [Mycena rebaudengoi]|nr:hypothetical protein C8J57DRAFT_1234022 [Mycena rebaudengoi]